MSLIPVLAAVPPPLPLTHGIEQRRVTSVTGFCEEQMLQPQNSFQGAEWRDGVPPRTEVQAPRDHDTMIPGFDERWRARRCGQEIVEISRRAPIWNSGPRRSEMEDLLFAGITDLSARIREPSLSPVAIVDACLAQITTLNPRLNAFITVDAEGARRAAIAAESDVKKGHWRGPLHGVPVAVKDFYDTKGLPTTAAFENFANRIPTQDAAVVRRLKSAGAILIGKTNMDTLGMGTTGLTSFFGPVKNPWNVLHITGGSSSGSAAAVASGMCYAAVGTDAIGSCRLPAACCGVVGFKGTYGLISAEGILAGEAPPDEAIVKLSHPGVTTRRVADAALVVDVLKERAVQSRELADELGKSRLLRAGIASGFKGDAEVTAAFTDAVNEIVDFGHEASKTIVPFAGPSRGMGSIERDRKAIARELFGDIDVLLLPTTTTTVPRAAAASNPQALSAENTAFANYYGLPAISVPCGFAASGLPLGLQIVAKPGADLDALWLGDQYETAAGWFRRHPKV